MCFFFSPPFRCGVVRFLSICPSPSGLPASSLLLPPLSGSSTQIVPPCTDPYISPTAQLTLSLHVPSMYISGTSTQVVPPSTSPCISPTAQLKESLHVPAHVYHRQFTSKNTSMILHVPAHVYLRWPNSKNPSMYQPICISDGSTQ